ncbi:prenyltransferase beta subunit [Armatimonas rosea]|uniref:Prenyltransferase beta subunit n=1 Tax=Armatimonas rosea TaxID=685828 RepID=A0A7W9W549_ARMRO|nr:prenyltransferase/squalene oxidase repeat-containing protein [Armatimonas rosea]MBB6048540.1 prenyltransferase beta subunit [Armatimonas rosea]
MRLEMLQVARLAPRLLGEATELVGGFLTQQQHPDGGFQDRGGASDLYYTVFGVEGLAALQRELPTESLHAYLQRIGDGEALDFVHLTCLARAWANLPKPLQAQTPTDAILTRLEACRSADGGYHMRPGQDCGTLYCSFLAWGAYQDLGVPLPNPEAMAGCIHSLRARDGGYANEANFPLGLTPSTAAAATLIRQLGLPHPPELPEWLLERACAEGGFCATPVAPLPDLLSTATALHALAGMQVPLETLKEPCLDFLDTLWTSRGAFFGSWTDDLPDCEYTYYGLLSLGHLSV